MDYGINIFFFCFEILEKKCCFEFPIKKKKQYHSQFIPPGSLQRDFALNNTCTDTGSTCMYSVKAPFFITFSFQYKKVFVHFFWESFVLLEPECSQHSAVLLLTEDLAQRQLSFPIRMSTFSVEPDGAPASLMACGAADHRGVQKHIRGDCTLLHTQFSATLQSEDNMSTRGRTLLLR